MQETVQNNTNIFMTKYQCTLQTWNRFMCLYCRNKLVARDKEHNLFSFYIQGGFAERAYSAPLHSHAYLHLYAPYSTIVLQPAIEKIQQMGLAALKGTYRKQEHCCKSLLAIGNSRKTWYSPNNRNSSNHTVNSCNARWLARMMRFKIKVAKTCCNFEIQTTFHHESCVRKTNKISLYLNKPWI